MYVDRNWITFPPKIFSYYIWIADRVTRDRTIRGSTNAFRILLVCKSIRQIEIFFLFFQAFSISNRRDRFHFSSLLVREIEIEVGRGVAERKKKERGKKEEVTISTRENGGGEGKQEKKKKKKSERVGPCRKYTCGVRLTRVKILWQSTLGRIGRCSVYARRRWEPLKYLSPDMVRVSCKADISVAPHINTSKRTVSRALPTHRISIPIASSHTRAPPFEFFFAVPSPPPFLSFLDFSKL